MDAVELLRVTLAQTEIVWEDPAANLMQLQQIVPVWKGRTDLIVLPETFATGFSPKSIELAQPMEGSTVKLLKEMALSNNLAIAGTLLVEENQNYYNRFLFVYPNGEIIYYDKRHLFSPGHEDDFLQRGTDRVVIEYLGWRILPLICYDLRFPVWSRNRNDVDLMIYSANWPETRSDVWKTLLKARAIENQVYVAGVNRVGIDANQISYCGESLIYDPTGQERLFLAKGVEQWACETLSIGELNDLRTKFPVINDADSFEITNL